jgi:hypothetical protein
MSVSDRIVEARGTDANYSDLAILRRLQSFDVAPVAGGVADRDENGHVPAPGLGERLRTPLPPVDRIVRVLEEVGRGGTAEAIHAITISEREGAVRRSSLGQVP